MYDLTQKTSDLCFSLFASLSKNVSHNPNIKHKTKSNSYNKVELKEEEEEEEEEEEQSDLAHSGGGEEDEQRWGNGRGSVAW